MTDRIKKIYDSALKNEEFLKDLYEADGDSKPNFLSSDLSKNIFASVYYGWIVAKYGTAWKSKI